MDGIQNRAKKLIEAKMKPRDPPVHFQSLEHRRCVSGLCVFYKVQVLQVHHLPELRLPRIDNIPHLTRGAANVKYEE
ncbi:MAG: hypothetical protein AAFP20_25865, partial [Cyanobacteria bacterium J06614_10]